MTQVCWPTGPEIIREELRGSSITRVMQADDSILQSVSDLKPYVKEVYTTIISLDRQPQDLLGEMDPKSCRYELRKSEKLGYRHLVNQCNNEALVLFQNFFTSSGYRGPLTSGEWQGYLEIADIHTIQNGPNMIAAHVVMRDAPHRVRLLLSATADRTNGELKNLIGPLNRRLHWCEILFYKDQGFLEYDFGGVVVDPTDSRIAISQFKRSFGGKLEKQYNLVIIRNPLIRLFANSFVYLKSISKFLLGSLKLKKAI